MMILLLALAVMLSFWTKEIMFVVARTVTDRKRLKPPSMHLVAPDAITLMF